MGALLARFRKQKTTTEILEKLEDEIQQMEKFSVNTQAKQKRLVANFLAISIGLYTLGFMIFYFVFFPPTWMERLTYSIPLLVFPWVIIMLRKALSWFFQRRLQKNSNKLNILREEKKKILEKVMDSETYKEAVKLLNRFGDKPNGSKPLGAYLTPRASPLDVSTPNSNQLTPLSGRRNLPFNISPQQQQNYVASGSSPKLLSMSNYNHSFQTIRRRTPFPIINQQSKTALEKMVDYLVGDGLQNRFAMICKECFSHNGMALQEEFEYATFRCAFCNVLNPSRKKRPIAPPLVSVTRSESASSTASSSPEESETETRIPDCLHPETNKTELENEENETVDNEAVEKSPQKYHEKEKTNLKDITENEDEISVSDIINLRDSMISEKSENNQNNL